MIRQYEWLIKWDVQFQPMNEFAAILTVSDYCLQGIVSKGHQLHTCNELSSVSATTVRFESSDRYVAQ